MISPKDIVSSIANVVRRDSHSDTPLALHEPDIGAFERQAVLDCLESGWTSTAGGLVNVFEEKLAEYCGVSHAVACVNGSAALHIALYVSGVRPGDEVIVPAVSFIATANAVVYNQAVPHFVDVSDDDFGIDPERLKSYLAEISEARDGEIYNKNTGRRISCIVPLHCFGYPCLIEELVALGKEFGLPIVEDAAEALGSSFKEKALGSFGLASILSFNGNKIITTGGGGAILTNCEELARHARHLTNTAKLAHKWEYNHDELGYNYRLPSLNAALGLGQLTRMPEFIRKKTNLHRRYSKEFSALGKVRLLKGCSDSVPNHWLNAIILPENMIGVRDEVIAAAHDAGFMVRPLWGLLPTQQHLRNSPAMDCYTARSLAARTICLPSSSFL